MPWIMVAWLASLFALMVALVALVAGELTAASGIAMIGVFWAGVAVWLRHEKETQG